MFLHPVNRNRATITPQMPLCNDQPLPRCFFRFPSCSGRILLRTGGSWFGCLLWGDLLSVLVESNTRRGSSVAAAFARSDTNNLSVDGTADAVLKLQVHLWDRIFREDRGIRDITNSGRFNHVADSKSLDCLVLWCATAAVGAANWLYVAAAFLVTSIGRSLLNHICGG